jgi:hypothetical protein
MSANANADTESQICLECGASNAVNARAFWVCHTPLRWDSAGRVNVSKGPAAVVVRSADVSPWTPAILAVAAIAVLIGLVREAPGIAILLAIVVGPALLLTVAGTRSRRRKGWPVNAAGAIGQFLLSVAMVLSALTALGVVAVVAVGVWLFIVCSNGGFH